MEKAFMIIAMLIWGIGVVFALFTDNRWRNVGISYALLALGCIFFGLALAYSNTY